ARRPNRWRPDHHRRARGPGRPHCSRQLRGKDLIRGDLDLLPVVEGKTHWFPPREVRMALIRWEPVAELNTIQNEMNRLFNTFFDPSAPTGRGNGTTRRWLPPMDLVETPDHYVLRADLPGLSDGDVNIQLEDNVLTISGERKAEHEDQQEGYYRLERAFGA